MTNRIYLDNAATSWPKRQAAIDAASSFMADYGATAGRGSYSSARQADRWLSDARRTVARLIGAPDARSIAFGCSGTHVLNAALHGLIRPGDHVISSQAEHNSVLRPLEQLKRSSNIGVDYVRCNGCGVADLHQASALVSPATRWIVLGHASNVTGAVQDLDAWSDLARRCNAGLMIDASQTLGYLPINVQSSGIDVLAAAGHKGLQALPGTGLLYLCPTLQAQLKPLMTGGTGVHSEQIDAEPGWPQSVEVGNHNLPGIISMATAAEEMLGEKERPPVAWQTGWRGLLEQLLEGLRAIPSISVIGYSTNTTSQKAFDRIPVVSILVDGWDVHELAMVLDSGYGIEVRSGLHCAALVHDWIGSRISGGTLRLSPGHATTPTEIDQVLVALTEIANTST